MRFPNVRAVLKDMDHRMKHGDLIKTTNHQSVEVNQAMVEILHYHFKVHMHDVCMDFVREPERMPVMANLPWAEDHFKERISGSPMNPGTQYKHWPFAKYAEDHKTEMFNHNYMERYWPKAAGATGDIPTFDKLHFEDTVEDLWEGYTPEELNLPKGIRGNYGDLNDVINLMHEDIGTRQAYLPIFHPEDTGNANAGRKPCTLGYRFIVRSGRLDLTYDIRSCDFVRHLADDIYMTVRLAEFMVYSLRELGHDVVLGDLVMNITSLHMFLSDYQLRYKQNHKDA